MLLPVTIVTMSFGVVLCGESCVTVPQGNSVVLTCSGQAEDIFRHIYWKSIDANDVIADCYDRNDECYSHAVRKYEAHRLDHSDTSFESTLTINDVRHNMIIGCLLWLAGRRDTITVNTTRVVLVEGSCDQPEIAVSTIPAASTATTTDNIITLTTSSEQRRDDSVVEKNDVDRSSQCPMRLCQHDIHRFLVLGIILMAVVVVILMFLRRRAAMRSKLLDFIPRYNKPNEIPGGQGHYYNNPNFSADAYNGVSSAQVPPLPQWPILPCYNELNQSSLQPPAYSEIYETRTLLNDVRNETSTHTATCG